MSVDMKDTKALSDMSSSELMRLEQDIAKRHLGHFPITSAVWAFLNLGIWLALWPLVFAGILPVWAAFLIASVNITLSYLPSHEAQHDIYARPGSNLYWLNELIGHLSTIPLVLPYKVARLTHLEHHKHTNDPERDPDYTSAYPRGPLHSVWASIKNRQPRASGGTNKYGEVLMEMGTPEATRAMVVGVFYQLVFYGVLMGLAWSGHAIEAALIWWLPRHIALTYIQYYLSWAPHRPADKMGRYRNTRSFRSALGNIGSLGMQYHVIHHLHPRIPLFRTGPAYWEMRPILEARGVDVDEL